MTRTTPANRTQPTQPVMSSGWSRPVTGEKSDCEACVMVVFAFRQAVADPRAVPATSEPIATPSTRLRTAVATFADTSAPVTNGASTATAVANATTQEKNRIGLGANTS